MSEPKEVIVHSQTRMPVSVSDVTGSAVSPQNRVKSNVDEKSESGSNVSAASAPNKRLARDNPAAIAERGGSELVPAGHATGAEQNRQFTENAVEPAEKRQIKAADSSPPERLTTPGAANRSGRSEENNAPARVPNRQLIEGTPAQDTSRLPVGGDAHGGAQGKTGNDVSAAIKRSAQANPAVTTEGGATHHAQAEGASDAEQNVQFAENAAESTGKLQIESADSSPPERLTTPRTTPRAASGNSSIENIDAPAKEPNRQFIEGGADGQNRLKTDARHAPSQDTSGLPAGGVTHDRPQGEAGKNVSDASAGMKNSAHVNPEVTTKEVRATNRAQVEGAGSVRQNVQVIDNTAESSGKLKIESANSLSPQRLTTPDVAIAPVRGNDNDAPAKGPNRQIIESDSQGQNEFHTDRPPAPEQDKPRPPAGGVSQNRALVEPVAAAEPNIQMIDHAKTSARQVEADAVDVVQAEARDAMPRGGPSITAEQGAAQPTPKKTSVKVSAEMIQHMKAVAEQTARTAARAEALSRQYEGLTKGRKK